MTNIFTSKAQLAELKAANDTLNKTVSELTAKIESAKDQSQELASLKEQVTKERTEWDASMETMKAEFSAAINSLKQEIADLNKQKVEIEQTAKVQVEKAKEVSKDELKQQVNEGVAIKIASIGIKEDELPKISNVMTIDEARKTLSSLTGKAQRDFYLGHKALFDRYASNPAGE